ncbi:serine/threonine protein kinase [Aureliella helgolandensis]|uniref:Serine/threonine-protein kinase PrkC n=1 Tax=Aureliella helgolandensis TaxID=2527968 RepID=A0A518GGU8_9BACT|nr:serine/threonine-protein kinase [Aureliella helgolandensis]QDV27819.1 Serine/threonine-protein kinase PrkC [Aureliella helgolandensis]
MPASSATDHLDDFNSQQLATLRNALPDMNGTKWIGDYRILREIGRGGMGVVYEAVQESLGRSVAIKLLPSLHSLSAAARARFQREACAAARLHHTNIVPVFGIGETEGQQYYVMQLIEGRTLAEWSDSLKQACQSTDNSVLHPQDESQSTNLQHCQRVAKIALRVAQGLAFAHSHGVVHRDIKPENLLIDEHDAVWIADFGLAKSSGSDDLTHTGSWIGTLRYMAPEAFEGVTDARSDVYSLGVTLYELLTLTPAFKSQNREQLVQEILAGIPDSPRKFNAKIPKDLETIVLRATATDPARRFASAEQVVADLQHYLNGEPISARKISLLEKFDKWGRRHPATAALSVSIIIIAALGATGILWQWRDARAARGSLQVALSEKEQALVATQRALRTSQSVADLLAQTLLSQDQFGLSALSPLTSNLSPLGTDANTIMQRTQASISQLANPAIRESLLDQLTVVYITSGKLQIALKLIDRTPREEQSNAQKGFLTLIQIIQGRYSEAIATANQMQAGDQHDRAFRDFLLSLAALEIDANEATLQTAETRLREYIAVEDDLQKRQRHQFLHYMHLSLIRLRLSGESTDSHHWRECKRLSSVAYEGIPAPEQFTIYQNCVALATGLFQMQQAHESENSILFNVGKSLTMQSIEQIASDLEVSSPVRSSFLIEIGDFLQNVSKTRYLPSLNSEIETIYRLALEGISVSCPGEPRQADMQCRLAQVLIEQGERAEAEELLANAQRIRARMQFSSSTSAGDNSHAVGDNSQAEPLTTPPSVEPNTPALAASKP